MIKNKIVTIGITSSIAAFKVPQLIRMLQKKGVTVKCLVTPEGKKFISTKILESLTNHPVYTDDVPQTSFEHIDLANQTDLFILAPLTANTLSKIAQGLADNLLTSVILATRKPVLLCPAMNEGMWDNTILQTNLRKLTKVDNFTLVNPEVGKLACGTEGIGRLASLEKIVIEAEKIFTPQILENQKILISLGATREPLDPVRFLSNRSSGKMGYALAETAYLMGAEVRVVAGHTEIQSNFPFHQSKVETANEMYTELEKEFKKTDIFVSAAAVSDFKSEIETEKIESGSSIKIKFKPTHDILKNLAKHKTKEQIVIGFALESENLEKNAFKKLKAKKLDFIIANEIDNLGTDEGSCLIINQDNILEVPKMNKHDLAFKIWREIM